MLKEYEASGKTLDEAIDMVCLRAGRTIDELNIEVLDMPAKGIFGFGHRDARVRATFEVPEDPAPFEARPSTFGQKRSKQERLQRKKEKIQQEVEIKPIVAIDPAAVPEEIREQAARGGKPSRPQNDRPQGERAQNDRPQGERAQNDRPQGERAQNDRPRKSQSRPKSDRSQDPRQKGKERSGEKLSGEKLSPEQEAEARRKAAARRESRATPVTEGEMAEQLGLVCRRFLDPIFCKLQVQPEIQQDVRDGVLWFCFSGASLGLLIGRRGETLNALQYLTNLVANKDRNDHVRIVLDVEGYREGREETLSALAHKMADKAVRTGRRVELEPMNPHERRVVHLALQNDKRVDTVSHGEEPYRRVVISKKGSGAHRRRRNRGGNGGRPTNDQPVSTAPAQAPVEPVQTPVSAPAGTGAGGEASCFETR